MELNTANCCFICLHSNKSRQSNWTSMKNICKLLQIDVDYSLENENYSKDRETDVNVLLCEECREVSEPLSVLFMKLEAIYLEVDYYVDVMHKKISKSYKDDKLTENYSKRMSSSHGTLKDVLIVDNFRKLFGQKCSSTRYSINTTTMKVMSCKEENEPLTTSIDTAIPPQVVKISEHDDVIESEIEAEFHPQDMPTTSEDPEYELDIKREEEDPIEPEIEAEIDFLISDVYSMEMPDTSEDPLCDMNIQNSDTEEVNAPGPSYSNHSQCKRNSGVIDSEFNPKKHKCSSCNKEYTNGSHLRRHIESIHLKKRFTCPKCGTLLASMDYLKVHSAKCNPIIIKRQLEKQKAKGKIICTACNNHFPSIGTLNRHYAGVHLNIRKYECDICKMKFKRGTHLTRHRDRVHLGVKFPCKFCKVDYKCKYELKAHETKCFHNVKSTY